MDACCRPAWGLRKAAPPGSTQLRLHACMRLLKHAPLRQQRMHTCKPRRMPTAHPPLPHPAGAPLLNYCATTIAPIAGLGCPEPFAFERHEAEALVEAVTAAERAGHASRLADSYAASGAAKRADAELAALLAAPPRLGAVQQKELAAKAATSTPWCACAHGARMQVQGTPVASAPL